MAKSSRYMIALSNRETIVVVPTGQAYECWSDRDGLYVMV